MSILIIKAKEILRVVLILIVLVVLSFVTEIVRNKTGIPISVGDILFIPLSLVLLYIIIISIIKNNKTSSKNENILNMTFKKRIMFSFVILLLIVISFFILWIGYQAPFTFFTSVRGGAHGYTLIILGFTGIYLGCIGLFKTFFIAPKSLNKK